MAVGQSDFLIADVVVDPEIAVANESNLKNKDLKNSDSRQAYFTILLEKKPISKRHSFTT